MATDDMILTPAEVAKKLRLDPKTVARWAELGRIPSIKLPSGHRRYRAADVDAIIGRKAEPRLVSWGYRQQPDLDELAAAIEQVSKGQIILTQVDTFSSDCAVVISAEPLTVDDAYRLWAGDDE